MLGLFLDSTRLVSGQPDKQNQAHLCGLQYSTQSTKLRSDEHVTTNCQSHTRQEVECGKKVKLKSNVFKVIILTVLKGSA